MTVLTAVPTFWSQLARFLERHPDAGALAPVRLAVSSGDSLPPSVADRLRRDDGDRPDRGAGVLGVLEHRHLDPARRVAARARSARAVAGRGDPAGRRGGRPGGAAGSRGACGSAAPPTPPATGVAWPRPASWCTGRGCAWATCSSQVDGVYRHLGRSDDLFKVDARWVSPAEVEAAILTHPAVAEAAVVGLPGARRARSPRGLRGAGARRRRRSGRSRRRASPARGPRARAPQGAPERDGAGGAPASALGQDRPPPAPRGLSRTVGRALRPAGRRGSRASAR